MEILEEQEERLDLTLSQEESRDRLEDPLAALRRVERVPRRIVDGEIQRARSGVISGSNVRSSVRSLPATRSRIARGSSFAWIPRYAFNSPMTGRYGAARS